MRPVPRLLPLVAVILTAACVPKGPSEGYWRRGACAVFERAPRGQVWPATREEVLDCAGSLSVLAVCLDDPAGSFLILKSGSGDFACVLRARGPSAYKLPAWLPPPPDPKPAPAPEPESAPDPEEETEQPPQEHLDCEC